MSRLRTLKIILSILLIVVLAISTNAATLTQESFLEQLKESHPIFVSEKLTAQIEQKRRDSYLGAKDWNVQSAAFYSHEEPSFVFAGPEKTDAISLSGSIDRAIWSTGGRLSASFSSTYADLTIDIDPNFGIPGSYFENRLAVTYSHPLLRNKAGRLDRLQYELSQFNIDVSDEIALENEESFLAESADKFLNWVLLVEQERIIIERLALSEEELTRTREKRASNLIDEVDVIRAEDAVRLARQNQLLIRSRVKALQSELAVLTQDESLLEMTPQFPLYETKNLPSLRDATARLKDDSRLLKALAIRIEQQKLLRSGFEDQTKADLSLIGQVGLKNAKQSYGRSLVMDIPEARIGIQLGFPVGARTAKAQVAQTDLITMQLEQQMQQLTINLSASIASLLTQASELEAVLKLNIEQIESAKRKTVEELKIYNQGRGELTFVIQSRDSEQAAQLTYAANSLTYHKLLLAFSELTDQLHK